MKKNIIDKAEKERRNIEKKNDKTTYNYKVRQKIYIENIKSKQNRDDKLSKPWKGPFIISLTKWQTVYYESLDKKSNIK